jgi:hypothetical protein
MALAITSPAFSPNASIPPKFTREGNVSAQSSVAEIMSAAKATCLAEAQLIGLFENPQAAPKGRGAASPGVRPSVADADKIARTGSVAEPVRNTPPAGAWNDVARNE